MWLQVIAIAFVLLLAASPLGEGTTYAQSVTPDHSSDADAPLEAADRAAIVRQLFEAEFAGIAKPTRVPVDSSRIDESWLPWLPNVEFVILSPEERTAHDRSCVPYYWVTGFDRRDGAVFAGLARGTDCSSSGGLHRFVFEAEAWVRQDEGVGGGFGHGTSHCGCGTRLTEVHASLEDSALSITPCAVELTDAGRTTTFRYHYIFIVETDRRGAVVALTRLDTKSDATLGSPRGRSSTIR